MTIFDQVEAAWNRFKTHPIRNTVILIAVVLFVSIWSLWQGYLSTKGGQLAQEKVVPGRKPPISPEVKIPKSQSGDVQQPSIQPQQEPESVALDYTFIGSHRAAEDSALSIRTTGSFGSSDIEGTGTLNVELSLTPETARYETIIFESRLISTSFKGRFKPALDEVALPITLDMSYKVIFRTTEPSKLLSILPTLEGSHTTDPFFTSGCNFSCYALEISGYYSLSSLSKSKTGTISSVFTGRGLGADTESEIAFDGYPESVSLKDFRWYGNSGGVDIPSLVNDSIKRVRIEVKVDRLNISGFSLSTFPMELKNS